MLIIAPCSLPGRRIRALHLPHADGAGGRKADDYLRYAFEHARTSANRIYKRPIVLRELGFADVPQRCGTLGGRFSHAPAVLDQFPRLRRSYRPTSSTIAAVFKDIATLGDYRTLHPMPSVCPPVAAMEAPVRPRDRVHRGTTSFHRSWAWWRKKRGVENAGGVGRRPARTSGLSSRSRLMEGTAGERLRDYSLVAFESQASSTVWKR